MNEVPSQKGSAGSGGFFVPQCKFIVNSAVGVPDAVLNLFLSHPVIEVSCTWSC